MGFLSHWVFQVKTCTFVTMGMEEDGLAIVARPRGSYNFR
jgi:hypothetical protein